MKTFKKVYIAMLVIMFTFSITLSNTLFAAGPALIDLGDAGDFVILAKTGISTTGATSVVGDIGVSPTAATSITGFDLILQSASAFSTSALVTGKVYAPGYANPTPVNMTTAISNMETAYTDGAGRSLNAITELGAGNIGGMTLVPGLYKWGTGVTIPTDVTLTGSANDVWIFVVAQNLNISSAKSIVLAGGAKAGNIFWVVAGQTTIDTGATFNGNILDQTAVVLNTGATLNGRALAQTAVTLDASAVTIPSGASSNSDTNTNTNTDTNTNTNTNTDTNTNSNTDTNTNTNSSNDNVNSNTTSAVTCSPGQLFKAETGERCTFTNVVFCPPGQMFNGTSGERCNTIISSSAVVQGASGYTFGGNLVKDGSRGEFCKAWQKFFNDKAGAHLSIDGNCGPLTIAVAEAWQGTHGLTVDGILGVLSRAKANMQK